MRACRSRTLVTALGGSLVLLMAPALAQLVDLTDAPNSAESGIAKSLDEQIGAGQGDILTPDSSLFIIRRDPFRAIKRGRQLFQRKFRVFQGLGPRTGDGDGVVNEIDPALIDHLEFYLLNYFKPGTYQHTNFTNDLFATAEAHLIEQDDGSGFPTLKPAGAPFVVRNFFGDFKRHDLGPNFWEIDFDGSIRQEFLTEPLWGVASTALGVLFNDPTDPE